MAILSWQLRSTIQTYCFELVIYDGNRCLECLTFPNINYKVILVEELHSSVANITFRGCQNGMQVYLAPKPFPKVD